MYDVLGILHECEARANVQRRGAFKLASCYFLILFIKNTNFSFPIVTSQFDSFCRLLLQAPFFLSSI